MSVILACLGFGLIIYPSTDSTVKGVGVTLLLTVSSSWFIPSAARQVAQEVKQNVTDALPDTEVKK